MIIDKVKDLTGHYIIDIDDVIYTYRETKTKIEKTTLIKTYLDPPISSVVCSEVCINLVFRNDKVGDEIHITNHLAIIGDVDLDTLNDYYFGSDMLIYLNKLTQKKEIIIGYDYGIQNMSCIYKVKKSGIKEYYSMAGWTKCQT